MSQLTPKQQQIYDYILTFADEHGYPPSVREIAEAVDLKSPSTVHFHLKGLRAAGLISQAEGKTRAITINSGLVHGRKDQVPVVGNVAAGSPILAEECIEDYLTFDTEGRTGEHFALKVRGESMRNASCPGTWWWSTSSSRCATATSWWRCLRMRPPSRPTAIKMAMSG